MMDMNDERRGLSGGDVVDYWWKMIPGADSGSRKAHARWCAAEEAMYWL